MVPPSQKSPQHPAPMARVSVAYDRYALRLNGKRTVIRSGAMHYFRLPSPELWRDRLFKLKAAGYNTVDLYFCWAYHSPAPGEYDFTGPRDIRHLLDMTQEMGLYVIARPGPYINAEYTAGGLPGWLLAREDVVLRNRTPDGAFVWSEPYMEAVCEWWDQLLPVIQQAPNVILVQIENEYATLDMEPDYMQALYEMVRLKGITVPIFHNDLYAAGLYQDIVDIYAFDNYSVTSFDTDWRQVAGTFSVLDNVERNFRPFCENRPLMVAELQAGWFGTWKGLKYERIVEHLGREHIRLATKSLLGQGLTIFNHYKAVGGTNWDLIGSTDTYTSYDFGAPISEAGLPTERLYEAKAINAFLASFDLAATERVENPELTLSDPDVLYAVRAQADAFPKPNPPLPQWVFLRNMADSPRQVTLDGMAVTLPAHDVAILPRNVRLACGYTLLAASTEPLYQSPHFLVLKGDRPVEARFDTGSEELKTSDHRMAAHVEPAPEGGYRLTCPALGPDEMATATLGALTVYVLGSDRIDRFWVQEDGFVVTGPDVRLNEKAYALSDTARELLLIGPHGTPEREKGFSRPEVPAVPLLKHWHSYHAAPELLTGRGFVTVSPKGPDFDTNALYEGSGWYRYDFPAESTRPERVTVDARHIWAVFLNGELLGEGHHLVLEPGAPPPPPMTLSVPAALWRDGGDNALVVFVDGLGHPKGFHDDARTPQGLLLLTVDGCDVTRNMLFSGGLSLYTVPPHDMLRNPPKSAPLVRLETRFHLEDIDILYRPIGVHLDLMDYERVNVYLNGVLIGRHWRECLSQTRYYLPEGILKSGEHTENRLELLLMNFSPFISLKDCLPTPAQVRLEAYGEFTKITL